ncbi:hypothetical protein BVC80_1231g5 [Macleaya cordata]|uniref:WAT1-related protein n=1 Tax=Macleaya cordata TaxID=56857 RepID=A0A200R2B2_MACCD|nr:hypothetical protein BVC80_1231g5 [Macleaya cordata]
MEIVKLKTLSGSAKVMGVVLCMLGAITLALYKGPQLKPMVHHHPFAAHPSSSNSIGGEGHDDEQALFGSSSGETWIKGCFLMLISNILWGLWLVLQMIYVVRRTS